MEAFYIDRKGTLSFKYWSWEGMGEPDLIVDELSEFSNYHISKFGKGSIVNYSHYAGRGWINPELQYVENNKKQVILQAPGGPANAIFESPISEEMIVMDVRTHLNPSVFIWDRKKGIRTIVELGNQLIGGLNNLIGMGS